MADLSGLCGTCSRNGDAFERQVTAHRELLDRLDRPALGNFELDPERRVDGVDAGGGGGGVVCER